MQKNDVHTYMQAKQYLKAVAL